MKLLELFEKYWTQVIAVFVVSVLAFFIGGYAGGIGLVFFAATLIKKLGFPTKKRQTDLSGTVTATKPKGVPQKDGEDPPVMPPPPEFPPKKP